LREVRWKRRSPSRCSSRVMAFETVGLERPSSPAARTKEPVSAVLAKIAHASRSGSFDIFRNDAFLTFLFIHQVRLPSHQQLRNTEHLEKQMIERRPFDALGGAHYDWLRTKHHFS